MTIEKMKDIGREAAKQVPALVVMAALVWMFLGAMERSDQHVERVTNNFEKAAHECHEVQRAAVSAIAENSEVIRDIKTVMIRMNNH